jgi:hypothetical protein
MRSPVRFGSRPHRWFLGTIALLAMVSQFVLAISPLAEGREDRMASHVEAGGVQTHYSHNDATCASCQARSIHGAAPRPSATLVEADSNTSAVVSSIEYAVSIGLRSQSNPRAPPVVI